MSVPHSALHSKVRKAAPEQRQPASCRYMPELQRMLKQHGIPLYGASCWSWLWCVPPFIRIIPFRSDCVMGKRDTFRFEPSVVSPDTARRKESPLCLPGRPLSVPPGRYHFYKFHPHRFYFGNTVAPFYRTSPCLRHPCRHRLGFSPMRR